MLSKWVSSDLLPAGLVGRAPLGDSFDKVCPAIFPNLFVFGQDLVAMDNGVEACG